MCVCHVDFACGYTQPRASLLPIPNVCRLCYVSNVTRIVLFLLFICLFQNVQLIKSGPHVGCAKIKQVCLASFVYVTLLMIGNRKPCHVASLLRRIPRNGKTDTSFPFFIIRIKEGIEIVSPAGFYRSDSRCTAFLKVPPRSKVPPCCWCFLLAIFSIWTLGARARSYKPNFTRKVVVVLDERDLVPSPPPFRLPTSAFFY